MTIPCHLIAGPLGVGKTTAVLHYVRNRGSGEKIGVLVNDFGVNGLDGTVIEEGGARDTQDLVVHSIPGGCLCCTSAAYFEAGLRKLAGTPGIERIIVEPSGVVMLDQMKAQLLKAAPAIGLAVQPVIVLVNTARFQERHFTDIPYYAMLVREADVLVGNRCDLATNEQIDRFTDFAVRLDHPHLRVYTVSHGCLPGEAFAPGAAGPGAGAADTGHLHADGLRTDVLEWEPENRFDLERLLAALTDWCRAQPARRVERLKGTLNTDRGWQLVEVAQGLVYARPFAGADANRIDRITNHPASADGLRELIHNTALLRTSS